jgi:hypothetical protein
MNDTFGFRVGRPSTTESFMIRGVHVVALPF